MKQSRWWLRAPVLVAPDKFKGTMSASEVGEAIARGLRAAGREAEVMPVADGGEGTADALVRALGGEWMEADTVDALARPIRGRFALLHDGRAIVEAAEASGLWRLDPEELDPWNASTWGTGELIAAAAEAGAKAVLVAVGGTASTDGGAGALEALDEAGVDPELVVVCDVRTPFEHAAKVFAPQKGASPDTVKRLGRRLAALARRAKRDPRGVPMTGAGGGLSGGLYAFRGAKLVPGAPFVLDALGFDQRMRRAAFVVTGEGKLDEQTLVGKAAGEVAVRCRQAGVACHAIVGRDDLDDFSVRILALDSLAEAGDPATLEAAAARLA
ncbi:MAG TPA: glycerate kinase [Solirubrobacteraceae bacterium]